MTDEKTKNLDLAISQIEKQYGKGSIMRLGNKDVLVPVSVIPTGSISIDSALGVGGFPRGRVIEVYGPESGGKTTLTLHVIAEAQKLGGQAAFIDAEHALDVQYAKALYRAMIPLKIRWIGLSTTRIAEDDELLRLAAQSGCKGLLIGFESISQDTLNETHKGFHAAPKYAEVVKKLHDHGIGIQIERAFEWCEPGHVAFLAKRTRTVGRLHALHMHGQVRMVSLERLHGSLQRCFDLLAPDDVKNTAIFWV